jgi:outer membrane protein assembly factor BamA
MLEARLAMPRLAGDRTFFDVNVRRYGFPLEDFFGLGPQSRRSDHATYALHSTEAGAAGGVRVTPWLSLSGGIDYLTPRIGSGGTSPTIEALFSPTDVPGLSAQPDFVRYQTTADLNYREPRGNPRRGGRYRLRYSVFDDRDTIRYAFDRVELDLQQYISLLRDRRVLALHGLVSWSDADAGHEVPFYLQRTLGGPDDLRGFRRFRFRDRNLLLLQAEYRWEIFPAVDGAIFYDAGKVASRGTDLDLHDLESDYGIGFRFGTSNGVFLRVEGAFGSSAGKHFIFRFGHVF